MSALLVTDRVLAALGRVLPRRLLVGVRGESADAFALAAATRGAQLEVRVRLDRAPAGGERR